MLWRPQGLATSDFCSNGGQLEIVRLLLERDAKVNAHPAPGGGRTALQAASGGGYLQVVHVQVGC
jgi:hypothetical protein